MNRIRIFVSSAQKEFAAERRAIKAFLEDDALLCRFCEVFLFENLPASGRRTDEVYLSEVDRCDVYLGLIGNDYGHEDAQGFSPTEHEFDRATAAGKDRLIFVKGDNDALRHPKMRALLRRVGEQLIRRRFTNISELTESVYASLVNFLENRGMIQNWSFDDRLGLDVTLADLDGAAMTQFVRQARDERQFPLDVHTPMADVLTHLGLLRENRPTNAAILLFGSNPQRIIPYAEVRCMHFHGTEPQRPAPFYQIYKGTLFSQVDQAANFVLSVTNLSVGTRALGPRAPVSPEIPPDVIREAIVNAVAHRDYTSGAAIQVAVYADRVEVWNPGSLLPPLTPESLRLPHRSVARNHRICECLFLAGYIEKFGTGTLMMIRESLAHALPEPVFQQRGGEFASIIWRDWLTEKVLVSLNINPRQLRIVTHIKAAGRISNQEYQQITGVGKKTASRDLADMVAKGVLERVGTTGRGAYYVLVRKGDKKGTKRSSTDSAPEGAATSSIQVRTHTDGQSSARQRSQQAGLSTTAPVRRLLELLSSRGELGGMEILNAFELKNRRRMRETYLVPAFKVALIEYTIPDKPNSPLQKYRLTEAGRRFLNATAKEADE